MKSATFVIHNRSTTPEGLGQICKAQLVKCDENLAVQLRRNTASLGHRMTYAVKSELPSGPHHIRRLRHV